MTDEYLSKSSSFRKETRFIHDWTIKDYVCEAADAGVIHPSTNFAFQLQNGMQFNGYLTIVGDKCSERCCRLFLRCSNHSLWKVKCIFSYDAAATIQEFLHENLNQKDFNLTTATPYKYGYIHPCSFISKDHTIRLEIVHVEYEQKLDPSLPNVKNSETEMKHTFVELFKSQEFWDVTFEVGGQMIRAYKGILASQSKVFAAMFKHDMTEAQSNRVTIDDIEFDVFEEIIRYLYTGEVENINEMALKLFPASDKYDLENLKNLCAKELAAKISNDTAAEILILADLHTSKELKQVSVNFINNNKKAVGDTEGWKKILKNYSHLLGDLYLNS